MTAHSLFSIGHSNHDLDRLTKLLRDAGVTAVADVRSQPYSPRCPQFNQPELKAGLQSAGIGYLFLGSPLGGRPRDPELYDSQGRVDYEQVRRTDYFQEGLDQLADALKRDSTAMLCSEEDPIVCHRGLMIAPALLARRCTTIHLRSDGSQETMDEFEQRLLAETGVGAELLGGLFEATLTTCDREELLNEAYRAQARRKAFRLRSTNWDDNSSGDHP